MAVKIADAAQNAAVDAVVDLVDAGAAAGTLKIYTGTQPADADTAPTGTLLATFTLNDPAFGAAASGSAALDVSPAISDSSADGTGTAGYFLLEDSDGNNILTGSITGSGGGGDMELDNTSITTGQTVNITSLSIDIPASE